MRGLTTLKTIVSYATMFIALMGTQCCRMESVNVEVQNHSQWDVSPR